MLRGRRWGRGVLWLAALVAGPIAVEAADPDDRAAGRRDLQRLEERVRVLELRDGGAPAETDEGKAHRLHPIHVLGEAKVTGGLTLIAQGGSSRRLTPSNQAEASFSLDLFFEHQVSPSGLVLVYLDVQQGRGLTSVPMFTGPNADIEAHDGDLVALHEVWYEQRWRGERIIVTVGKYDPTGFFDANLFANDERRQFLGSPFVNNPSLEFSGNTEGYGLGAVLRVEPLEGFEAAVGIQDGDGDFEEVFARPWTIGEVVLEPHWGGREGHYRFYAWRSRTLRAPLLGGADMENHGIGFSADHQVTDHLGVWARYGAQNGAVAPFDRSTALGIHLGGGVFGRRADTFGIGYATLAISNEYRMSRVAGGSIEFDADEHDWEAYYRIVFSGDGVTQGIALTPDVQWIANAGGDRSIDPIVIWGLRMQALF